MLKYTLLVQLAAYAAAQSVTRAITSSSSPSVTAVSACHMHSTTQFCMVGTTEYQVLQTATATTGLPSSYTGCHNHAAELFCLTPNGGEVQLVAESASPEASAPSSERNCHFHAGVEHCVGGDESEHEISCEKVDRDYNFGLRVGLLFVMLATSFIGVFGPIVIATKFSTSTNSTTFILLRQFGTGIIISTAFVHLYTHASLMFNNPCLGELKYESTTSAILMAGIFLTFVVEYFGHRWAHRHDNKSVETTPKIDENTSKSIESDSSTRDVEVASTHSHADVIGVTVLEAGIVFHSLLIGITLVVAGDSFFLTLFAVITFHQLFEGIALGTLIANLTHISMMKKAFMAMTFAVITPIGMGIGIGVLKSFNGNNKSTIVAIGTLNAFSAGILVWVGVVEMWAKDWVHGVLKDAKPLTTMAALIVLAFGMGIMSFLGKWA